MTDQPPVPPPYPPPPLQPPFPSPALGDAPAYPAAPEPGGGSSRDWLWAGLALSLVALLGVGGWVAWSALRDDGPSHPDEWDSRVADIVEFVEDERGLRFDHPVQIDFLTEDEFRAEATTSEDDLTDEDRAEIEQATAQLRALGLVEGDIDLFEEQNDLYGDATLGFYSYEDERIAMRGTELTPGARVTLAHELTHALQDQQFDLAALRERSGEDASLVYSAIVEGDASNVEEAYSQDELDEDERSEAGEETAGSDDAQETLAEAEPVLVAFLAAPYAIGPSFTSLIAQMEGSDAIDALLEGELPSEAVLFDPSRLGEPRPDPLPIPELPEGAELVDDGEFGAFAWYLVLASRLDAKAALDAVDGWETDSYATYSHDDRVCVQARFQGVDGDATAVMGDLLEQWAAAMPEGAASVERTDDHVELTSCDPGAEQAVSPDNNVLDALQYPVTRVALAQYIGESVPAEADLDEVWCVADGLVDEFTLEELSVSAPDPEMAAAVTDIMSACLIEG